MSRRSLISEALASTPAEPVIAVEDVAVAKPRTTFTTKRLDAFGESARMVKKPSIRLKPSECSIWSGNARDYELLNEQRLRSLIDSIQAENGNRIPVVVRRTPDAEKRYELLIGTRRHWAVSWLNANHYPDIELVAIIEDIDDEAAFRLADIENREREDISDLERGENYRAAVAAYYDGIQARMAERVKLSTSTLARYIGLTEIPKSVVSAFHSPMDLQVRHGDKLLPLIRNAATRPQIEEAAAHIASEQSFRQSGDEEPISGAEVVARLVKAASSPRRGRARKLVIEANGSTIGQIDRDQGRGLTFTLTPTDLSADDILEALRPLIENAKILKGRAR
ncbi:ParB/RepB/Spo0J family partition protein [Novosphingobium sp. FGD1]|jgi:ParB family chromosome partitioning protein|uniref:Chromosome partitioning protein n=2 Tax=Novosphingobium TaxID=165696 RepID=T0H1Y5_9SPHN|nr:MULTISPECIES: ParB/RepB/Spo0J family partition protein [Novosphingobium]EQB10331.1 chromosome partitioning protein [Novosphingobium lindaniclasticum LE124]MYL99499.1 ParB/RepB/Spo0J family partition protein [Novosphingobium silvae]